MFQRIWQQLLKLWRLIKQVFIKSPPTLPPTTPPPSSSECEQKFMELLEGVANGWSRGTIQGFLIGTKIKNADWENWLQAFGERLLASPELNLELGGRLLRLGEANYGKISEMAGKIGRELLARENQGGEKPGEVIGKENDNLDSSNLTTNTDNSSVESPTTSKPMATEIEVSQEAVELFNQAGERYDAGDLAGALAAYDKALEIDPNYVDAWNRKGNALKDLGRNLEALAAYDKALKLEPNYHHAWNRKGNAFKDLGRNDEALAAYERSLEIEPNYHYAWNGKGNALNGLGRNLEALTAYGRSLEIEPNYHYAWNGKGNALNDLKRYEEAFAACERSLEIDPNYVDAWNNKGNALNGLGRNLEALAAYERSLEIEPNYHHAWNRKGNAFKDLGRNDEALAAYERSLEIEPNYHYAWNGKGNALNGLGRNLEALTAYGRSLEIDPNYHHAWNGKGNALNGLGRNLEALAACDKALEITSDQYWEAWFNRGLAFLNSGDYEKAIQNWDEALEKYQPSNRDYRQACGKLHQQKGKAHYRHGKQTAHYFEFFHKAKASYEEACQFLKSPLIAEVYLEVLQDLIVVCRTLGDPKTNEYIDEATTLLENLILADDTHPEKKLRLSRKFAGLYQLAVDQLIESRDKVKALETAEKRKNSCLKWMQQSWQQPPESPNFSQMQELLKNNAQTAIIYWHLSPVSLTTFIIRHERDIQIIPTPLYPFSFFPGQSQSLAKWLQDWKSQYEDYRKTKEKSAIIGNYQWQDNLETNLEELQELLDIERISQEYLSGITQLILIPHRDLHLLPLHHLFKQPDLTITYLPSAQIGIKLSTVKIATTTLLSVENPRGDMLYATIESGVINQKYQQNQHLKSQAATRDSAINALKKGADIFHFTGHGAHNLKQPRESALELANNELLTLADIFEIDFSRYSVICLSACETGLTSAEDLIDEYVGLASGFLAKGANYVVSTLWKVNEISAALLMIQFHAYLKDDAPPVALKKAQTWLRTVTYTDLIEWYQDLMIPMRDYHLGCWEKLRSAANNIPQEAATIGLGMSHTPYSHPYHWAGFTITGNAADNA